MCPETSSYLASDSFYAGILHIITTIGVPIHLFGAYIIIFKTPCKMQSVKAGLLFIHLVSATLDVFFSFLAAPVLTLPGCSGYPLGISLLLGIPTSIQVFIAVTLFGIIGVTIMLFFEDRYHRLINGHKSKNWIRIVYIVIHYTIALSYVMPTYVSAPDQDIGKIWMKQNVPCLPEEVLHRPGYFVIATDNTIPKTCLAFMLTLVMSQVFFYVGAIFWHLFHTISISAATNRLQKQFFLAICIQVFIPLLLLTLPSLYIVLAIWLEYYNQTTTNLAVTMIPLHGVLSTITMLMVHAPYRQATIDTFCGSSTTKSNSPQIRITGNELQTVF
ncbi:Serpentine Receptor, class H [Caenorhabditis elegans]|uniref:Serpentine Receptor, class H n=1 Tax=Caenorhabditis elegans TaxID=6239 RepID=O46012_CAEEL|nr:Serpentine Receptor, class H [Caenorhabditis elegans]CAB04998.1 Serpentine Receptor, class H [Caenorhabditis elegans]|eukprot:NP_507618.1 Serpentine Receptor, class H [Caenorhabditis elegans]